MRRSGRKDDKPLLLTYGRLIYSSDARYQIFHEAGHDWKLQVEGPGGGHLYAGMHGKLTQAFVISRYYVGITYACVSFPCIPVKSVEGRR